MREPAGISELEPYATGALVLVGPPKSGLERAAGQKETLTLQVVVRLGTDIVTLQIYYINKPTRCTLYVFILLSLYNSMFQKTTLFIICSPHAPSTTLSTFCPTSRQPVRSLARMPLSNSPLPDGSPACLPAR